jgi:hypothetical protein
MAEILGSIPMQPYLRKFALSLENKGKDGVIVLAENTLIAKILKLLLTGKSALEKRSDMKKLSEKYTESLRFEINYRTLDKGTMYMPPKTVVYFNNLIYDLFHETLLQRILFEYSDGVNEKDVIERFLLEHGIEPDIDILVESVKKTSYRLRIAKNIPHFYTPQKRASKRTEYQRVR